MTSKKQRQPAGKAGNKGSSPQGTDHNPPYVSRYAAVDSHLVERNGSTDAVYGLAGERPAGRKLAQDIANICNQLHADGYDVFSVFPVISGRAVEATVESAESVYGRTYSKRLEVQDDSPNNGFYGTLVPRDETRHYVDTSAGYSVTDGAVIIARLIR